MLTCNEGEFPLTTFPFLSLSAETMFVFLNVGDEICLLCRLGGTIATLIPSFILVSSSTLEKGGEELEVLFRLGRPGQFTSIKGSDIGTDKELV